MSKIGGSIPVSSTPYHEKYRQHLSDLFDETIPSPIVLDYKTSNLEQPLKRQLPLPKSSKPAREKEIQAVKKRRVVSTEKAVPESTSSFVLKELRVNLEEIRNEAFSVSRNMYNMFPEPIILDSDEEGEQIKALPSTKSNIKKPIKKIVCSSKDKISKDIKNNKGCGNAEILISDEESINHIPKVIKKRPGIKSDGKGNSIQVSNIKTEKVKEGYSKRKPNLDCVKNVKPTRQKLKTLRTSPRISNSGEEIPPLNDISNIYDSAKDIWSDTRPRVRSKKRSVSQGDPRKTNLIENKDDQVLSVESNVCNGESVKEAISVEMKGVKQKTTTIKRARTQISVDAKNVKCKVVENTEKNKKVISRSRTEIPSSKKYPSNGACLENVSKDSLEPNIQNPERKDFPPDCVKNVKLTRQKLKTLRTSPRISNSGEEIPPLNDISNIYDSAKDSWSETRPRVRPKKRSVSQENPPRKTNLIENKDDQVLSVESTVCNGESVKKAISVEMKGVKQKTTTIKRARTQISVDAKNVKCKVVENTEKNKKVISTNRTEIPSSKKFPSNRACLENISKDSLEPNIQIPERKNFPPENISRFQDLLFRRINNNGGIIARGIKTSLYDIGYLEVQEKDLFKGQRPNFTFVVIEGKAKISYLGVKQTLSPGDIIHIDKESDYCFESAEEGHVRFIYVKSNC